MIDSHWFRHPRVWITVGVVGLCLTMWNWLESRTVPTTFGAQVDIPTVYAGDTVRIEMFVHRDVDRACALGTSRYIISSSHASTTIVPYEFVSAEGRERREQEIPGKLIFNVKIPKETPSGLTKLITENKYVCTWNPTSWFVPIDDSWTSYLYVQDNPQ